MHWIEVDFKPSDAMIEGAMDEIIHWIAAHNCHQYGDQDWEENAAIHNSVAQFANLKKLKIWLTNTLVDKWVRGETQSHKII